MKYLLSVLLIFLSISLFAQPSSPSSLKAGIGMTRHFGEQVNAPTILVGFAKDFYPNTIIEINAEWAFPVDYSTDLVNGKLENYRFGMSLLYKIIQDRKQLFNLGIGFSAGFYNDEVSIINSGIMETNGEFKPGFAVTAEYDFILPSDWFFGARASIARYDANRNAAFLGLTTGLRF